MYSSRLTGNKKKKEAYLCDEVRIPPPPPLRREDVIELSAKTKLPPTLSDKVDARDKASFSLSLVQPSDPTVLHKYWACVPTREYRRKVASRHTTKEQTDG